MLNAGVMNAQSAYLQALASTVRELEDAEAKCSAERDYMGAAQAYSEGCVAKLKLQEAQDFFAKMGGDALEEDANEEDASSRAEDSQMPQEGVVAPVSDACQSGGTPQQIGNPSPRETHARDSCAERMDRRSAQAAEAHRGAETHRPGLLRQRTVGDLKQAHETAAHKPGLSRQRTIGDLKEARETAAQSPGLSRQRTADTLEVATHRPGFQTQRSVEFEPPRVECRDSCADMMEAREAATHRGGTTERSICFSAERAAPGPGKARPPRLRDRIGSEKHANASERLAALRRRAAAMKKLEQRTNDALDETEKEAEAARELQLQMNEAAAKKRRATMEAEPHRRAELEAEAAAYEAVARRQKLQEYRRASLATRRMTRKSMATAGSAVVADESSEAPMSPRTRRALGMEPLVPSMAACDGQGDSTAHGSPRGDTSVAAVHGGTTLAPHDPLASATDHLASLTDHLASTSDPLAGATDHLTSTSDPLAGAEDHLVSTSDPLAVNTDYLANTSGPFATQQTDIEVTDVETAKPRMATRLEPVAESLSRSSVLQEFLEPVHDVSGTDHLVSTDESAAEPSSTHQIHIQIDDSSALGRNLTTFQTL